MQLAEMLERRTELCENGHFGCERMLRLTEFIDDAVEGNGHYPLTRNQNCSGLISSVSATGLTLPGSFAHRGWKRWRSPSGMKRQRRLSTPAGLHGRISSGNDSITSLCKKPGTTTDYQGALNSQTRHWRRFVISPAICPPMTLLTQFT